MSLSALLDQCARGQLTPRMAFVHLAMEGHGPQALLDALETRGSDAPALAQLREAALRHPQAMATIRTMLETVDHERKNATLADIAQMFDAAVAQSPAASVTLFSLGDEHLLEEITEEVCRFIIASGLTGRDRRMLDLGCGIGRFTQALAPVMGHVTGVDISGRMIEEARLRCSSLANVTLLQIEGSELPFAASSFDFILAADVFPYPMQVSPGLAGKLIEECGRCLAGGGAMLILNFSYRGDVRQDVRDLARFARAAHLQLAEGPSALFSHWDGTPYLLKKPLTATSR